MPVFPTPGRAASTIRSLFWSPDVMRSRSVSPVGMPVTPFVLLAIRPSASVMAALISASMSRRWVLWLNSPSRRSSRLCASISESSISMVSSSEQARSLLKPRIISRRRYFSCTIRMWYSMCAELATLLLSWVIPYGPPASSSFPRCESSSFTVRMSILVPA